MAPACNGGQRTGMVLGSSRGQAEAGGPDQLETAVARANRLAAAGLRTGDSGQIIEAAVEYRRALTLGAAGGTRAGIEQNLGAAMCFIGQKETDPAQAAAAFELARRHLEAALLTRTRAESPQGWALAQANLALVHLCVHRLTGNPVEAMAGHIALDGAQEVFRLTGDRNWIDWIASIRAQLLKAVDRRKTLR